MDHYLAKSPDQPIDPLTNREREILALLSGDKSNQEIADQLYLALSTVKGYIQQIYNKLGVGGRREAVHRARELGLLEEGSPIPSRRHNLPAQLSSFIGREREIEQVTALLVQHRLVTLTGSGGTGKSRLSLQAANFVMENYPHGAWLVELASLADPGIIPTTIAQVLGVQERPGKRITDLLVDFLRYKQLLLILDNCEHLLEACANLADRLLHNCPNLTILASSRELLGVEGEAPYSVPPMILPDVRQLPSLEQFRAYDAVRLFSERAQVVSDGFEITQGNMAAVAQVVTRLDGIPLAIELAAARLRLLEIEQIAQRLDNAFQLLTGGSRSALPHHQTLRASVDWSYNLLSEPERILFCRLSIFAGDCNLQAVEQVCVGGLDPIQSIHPEAVIDLLSELVNKSLIYTHSLTGASKRFLMYETIRQYAQEKIDWNESHMVRSRHMQYYLHLAETIGQKIARNSEVNTADQLDLEQDNLRLAFEWSLRHNIDVALRLAIALMWYQDYRPHRSEEIDWLERALSMEEATRPQNTFPPNSPDQSKRMFLRAKGLALLGYSFYVRVGENTPNGDWNQIGLLGRTEELRKAGEALKESLAILRQGTTEHRKDLAFTLRWLSIVTGKPELVFEAQELCREINDQRGMFECLYFIGTFEPDPARRNELHLEQLSLARKMGDGELIYIALHNLGFDAFYVGEYDQARAYFMESYKFHTRIHNSDYYLMAMENYARSCFFAGDTIQALEVIDKTLKSYQETGNNVRCVTSLRLKFTIALAQGSYQLASEVIEAEQHINQMLNDRAIQSLILLQQSNLYRLQGETELAIQQIQECIKITQEIGHRDLTALATVELGKLSLVGGDLLKANDHFRECLPTGHENPDVIFMAIPFASLAGLAARKGEMERAARLFGAANGFCRGMVNTLPPPDRTQFEDDFTSVNAALGETSCKQLFEEGRRLTFEKAMAMVMEEVIVYERG